MRCLRFMNTKVTPCWIFVDALEQAHLFIHFNHSVPALILSSHRRQRFGLMLLPPVRLKQNTVMSGKVFAFLALSPFCLIIFRFLYPPPARPSSVLIVFALKETNHIVVFFTIHRYTITVHVVMFNICLG